MKIFVFWWGSDENGKNSIINDTIKEIIEYCAEVLFLISFACLFRLQRTGESGWKSGCNSIWLFEKPRESLKWKIVFKIYLIRRKSLVNRIHPHTPESQERKCTRGQISNGKLCAMLRYKLNVLFRLPHHKYNVNNEMCYIPKGKEHRNIDLDTIWHTYWFFPAPLLAQNHPLSFQMINSNWEIRDDDFCNTHKI